MKLIRGIHNIRAGHRGCVLTIGNFDGIHRGHKALLKRLKKEGQRLGLPVMVMFFEPQPLELFLSDKAPARLTRLRDKTKYLAQEKIDYLLCVKFDRKFADISAQAFITQLLVEKLNVKLLAVGDDFRFGAQRQGNFSLLQQAAPGSGFTVISADSFCVDGLRVSSTAVRSALHNGSLMLAEKLLGHPYSISGRVAHGDELARTMNFPTANLALKELNTPVKGVYFVDVYGLKRQPLPGIANIGTRPTVAGTEQKLEVHLLDVTMNLYGLHIDVVLRKKLRDERRFPSLDALKEQIASDVQMARKYFSLKASL